MTDKASRAEARAVRVGALLALLGALPPKEKECVTTRYPTSTEVAEMEPNPVVRAPRAPQPAPLPANRYKGDTP